MKRYLVVGETATSVLVGNAEFNGCDVVLGIYRAENEDSAIQQADDEHDIRSNGNPVEIMAYELA